MHVGKSATSRKPWDKKIEIRKVSKLRGCKKKENILENKQRALYVLSENEKEVMLRDGLRERNPGNNFDDK